MYANEVLMDHLKINYLLIKALTNHAIKSC